jgi:hypothetical protein
MGSMLAFRVVYRGFKPHSGKTVDYEIDICCIACTAVKTPYELENAMLMYISVIVV